MDGSGQLEMRTLDEVAVMGIEIQQHDKRHHLPPCNHS